ncbi:CpaF family protein [Sneathiella sp.]|uniref:CpaF family protein n=1 Tax=Sneathiella sp. TaxID=1964365 RepID=UPI002609F741|nr:CpaF family protein [Sneathiella sp.]MDF2368848.1 CpaF family protein [Sneathiella sp.]
MSLWRSSSSVSKGKPAPAAPSAAGPQAADLLAKFSPEIAEKLLPEIDVNENRSTVAQMVKAYLRDAMSREKVDLNVLEQRNLVNDLTQSLWLELDKKKQSLPSPPSPETSASAISDEFAPEVNGIGESTAYTQIVEEGVTVFGADPEAPVEVKAEFDQPKDVVRPPSDTDSDNDDEVEPVVPLAKTEDDEDEPDENDKSASLLNIDMTPETTGTKMNKHLETVKEAVQPLLMERIDISAAVTMDRLDLARDISDIITDILIEERIQLNQREQRELAESLMHDMLGLGPLEPLLADEAITDIMVNGPKQVYVEQKGKLVLSDCQFRDNAHVLQVAGRIVSHVGRRIDESNPLVDARLADGSRVNIIIPPLAIDGPSISIRKFAKQKITLDVMEKTQNLSHAMATVLKVAGRSRLNILISGGTGSGKTTMLNAISQLIDPGERIVTIEDAAELQLQQPHVVRLETRSANLEGGGEIAMRDLLKNSLRMRPDRIILGEIRGSEAIDMLQAMNTGHDGSLSTIHANRPREALTRLENMVGMSSVNLPAKAVRTQIASAIDLIVQISRMRDGVRRVTYISEVVGMEEDVITMQDLFWYEFQGEDKGGRLLGDFKSTGLRPHFAPRAGYFGLEKMLLGAM